MDTHLRTTKKLNKFARWASTLSAHLSIRAFHLGSVKSAGPSAEDMK